MKRVASFIGMATRTDIGSLDEAEGGSATGLSKEIKSVEATSSTKRIIALREEVDKTSMFEEIVGAFSRH